MGHFAEGLRLEPESVESKEAFDAGVRALAEQSRWRILILAFVSASVLAVLLALAFRGGVPLFPGLAISPFMPALAIASMTASTAFVLQFKPAGKALLAAERRAELRWLNVGLLLAALLGIILCLIQPTSQAAILTGGVAAAASAVAMVLYFECPGEWRRVCWLALAGVAALAWLADWLFPTGLETRDGATRVPAPVVLLFALVLVAHVVVRASFDHDPLAALRGLVIREGLQQRAGRSVSE